MLRAMKKVSILVVLLSLYFATPAHAEVASCYGDELVGAPTASGDVFTNGLTAAHPFFDFGTELLVAHAGAAVVVVVNDRGPHVGGRDLDLSCSAMAALGLPPGVYAVAVTPL